MFGSHQGVSRVSVNVGDTKETYVPACRLSLRMQNVGARDRVIRCVDKSRYPQTNSKSETRCDAENSYLQSHIPGDDLCHYHDAYLRGCGLENVTDATC